jgi:hypothetical protein
MSRRPMSVPVSFIVLIAGTALSYYVLHSQGWSWNGNLPIVEVWKRLSMSSRLVVALGFMMSAWGLGGVLNGLLVKRSDDSI